MRSPGGPPFCAGLALALEPDARPVLDAGLDLHRVRLDAPLAAGALALRARLLDHGAVAAAARARLREREQALALGLHAAAVALRADDGRGAGLRAGAAALAARGRHLDRHLRLDAAQRVLEREVHLAPRRRCRAGLARGARARARRRRRRRSRRRCRRGRRGRSCRSRRSGRRPGPAAPFCRAEAVVLLALLGVGEHVVRRLHLLEALLRVLVARVRVGMVLARELAVRLLDLVVARRSSARRVCRKRELIRRDDHPARDARRGRRACSPSG